MYQKKITALIPIDLSKAFDSVCHKMLLSKLEATGVSSAALKWFKSFPLTDRKQYVKIGQSKSTPLNVRHGVQQGSILWPLLFGIQMIQITKTSLNSYVDDSKISLSFPMHDKLEAKAVLEDLNNVASWWCTNSLLPNPGKSKFLVFCTPQLLNTICVDFTTNFLGKTLHPTLNPRDLEISLDLHLKYDSHISKLVSSCLSSFYQINRIRHLLDHETPAYIIKPLVLSN